MRFLSILSIIQIILWCSVFDVVAETNQSLPPSGTVILSDISLGKLMRQTVDFKIPFEVERTKHTITLNQAKTIEGKTYYISEKCIEVGKNERLLFQQDVILFDTKLKIINHQSGTFCPEEYSKIVLFGSTKKQKIECVHKRIFYKSENPIVIPTGNGVLLPPDIILIGKNGNIIIPNGFYYHSAEDNIQIELASTERKETIFSIVPVVELPKDYRFIVKKGIISNGILVCDNAEIIARNKQIFENVILTGSLSNETIAVEWFGCSVQGTAEENTLMLRDYVIPSAIATQANILHTANKTYQILGSYPIGNLLWGFDHAWIKDFKGITIQGKGKKTCIYGIAKNEKTLSDIFNIVDSRNLTISNLSVTYQPLSSQINNGANAFSLIHTIDNVTIEKCFVNNMPYVEGKYYPDGGKAFTIQCGPGTNQQRIIIRNNCADKVSYGVDYTKTNTSKGDKLNGVVFKSNTIKHAMVGAIVHEWNSAYGETVNPVRIENNAISDCQVGILCQTSKACVITGNTISNNRRPNKMVDYYDGVYGILTYGAYNTTIQNNEIHLKDCDSFVYANVYSYYPQYNGSVRNMIIQGNTIKGKSKKMAIAIGKKSMTKDESKMLDGITVKNNIIK